MKPSSVFIVFVMIMVYSVFGVFIFMALESGSELRRQKNLMAVMQNLLENHSCLSRETMIMLLDYIDRDLDTARYVLHRNDTYNVMWDIPGAASFVVSVITTIGYGHITPRTPHGKVACMFYAILGIPLMLVFLKGVGELLCQVCSRCLNTCSKCTTRNPLLYRIHAIFQGLLGLTVLFVVPCMVSVFEEKWSLLDAVYSSFITLTTIGFGDFVPGNPADRKSYDTSSVKVAVRLLNLLWTLMGLAYLSMLITAISNYYVRKTRGVKNKAKRRWEKLKQRVLQKLNCKIAHCNSSTQTDFPGSSSTPSLCPSCSSDNVASSTDRHVCLVAFATVVGNSQALSGDTANDNTITTNTSVLKASQSVATTQLVMSDARRDTGGAFVCHRCGASDCGSGGDSDGPLEIVTISSRTAGASVSIHSSGAVPMAEAEEDYPTVKVFSEVAPTSRSS